LLEAAGQIVHRFIGLRPKVYCICMGHKCKYACKGVSKGNLGTVITCNDYYRCWKKGENIYSLFRRFVSKRHKIYTVVQNKLSLSSNDDKRFTMDDNINTLAHGHHDIERLVEGKVDFHVLSRTYEDDDEEKAEEAEEEDEMEQDEIEEEVEEDEEGDEEQEEQEEEEEDEEENEEGEEEETGEENDDSDETEEAETDEDMEEEEEQEEEEQDEEEESEEMEETEESESDEEMEEEEEEKEQEEEEEEESEEEEDGDFEIDV